MVKYDKFNNLATRLKTFTHWSNHSPSPEILAVNGFFFLGGADVVQCYECGVVLHTWKDRDLVTVEHFKYSSSCSIASAGINTIEQCKVIMVDLIGQLKTVQNEVHLLKRGPKTSKCDETEDEMDASMSCKHGKTV